MPGLSLMRTRCDRAQCAEHNWRPMDKLVHRPNASRPRASGLGLQPDCLQEHPRPPVMRQKRGKRTWEGKEKLSGNEIKVLAAKRVSCSY